MPTITPFLWFDANGEEATNFYTAVFKNSKAGTVSRYDADTAQAAGIPEGAATTGSFELEGQQFMFLNAGPQFKFNEAISFFVSVETQEEVDYYWEKLTADGGEESQCGWLKDKFGLPWQIVPKKLGELLGDPDHKKAHSVMQAMLKMQKIDIAALQTAYDQA